MNLPAAIEDLGGQEIPKSMSAKAAEIKQYGGFDCLEKLINDLPGLLQRNKEILDEVCSPFVELIVLTVSTSDG